MTPGKRFLSLKISLNPIPEPANHIQISVISNLANSIIYSPLYLRMKRRSSNALHDAEDKAAKRLKIIEKLQEDSPHVPVKRNMKLESIEQVYEDLKSNRMPHTAFLKKNKERIGQIKLCDLVKRIATKVRTPSVDDLATAWNQLRGKTAAEWTTADIQCLIDSISGVG